MILATVMFWFSQVVKCAVCIWATQKGHTSFKPSKFHAGNLRLTNKVATAGARSTDMFMLLHDSSFSVSTVAFYKVDLNYLLKSLKCNNLIQNIIPFI